MNVRTKKDISEYQKVRNKSDVIDRKNSNNHVQEQNIMNNRSVKLDNLIFTLNIN